MSSRKGIPLQDVLLATALAALGTFVAFSLFLLKPLGASTAVAIGLGAAGTATAAVLGIAYAYPRLSGRLSGGRWPRPGADGKVPGMPQTGAQAALGGVIRAGVPPNAAGPAVASAAKSDVAKPEGAAAGIATGAPGIKYAPYLLMGDGPSTPAEQAQLIQKGANPPGSRAAPATSPGATRDGWRSILPFMPPWRGTGGGRLHFPDLGVFAYGIFGNVADKIAPKMSLEADLRSALIRSTTEKYVAKMLLVSIIIFAATTSVTTPILWRWFVPLQAVGFGLALGALATAAGFALMYIYPSFAARGRRAKIDSSLNFAAQYMAILAGAEVTLERIMKSILRSDMDQVVKDEFAEIVKRIDLFGEDLHTALEARIAETPSRRFADLLRGMLAVGSMGGNLRRYLNLQGKVLMRERRLDLRKQLDGLGLLAEIYISMGIVLPIIIVIMLSVMSFIGSSGIDALLYMYLTTFVLIPATSALMLLIVDVSVPREE